MRNILIVASTILLGSCRLVQPPAEASVEVVINGIFDAPPRIEEYLVDGELDKNGAFKYIAHIRDYSKYLEIYSDYLAERHDIVTEVDQANCLYRPSDELIKIPDLLLTSGDKDVAIEQLTSHIQLINAIVATHNKSVTKRISHYENVCEL